MKKLKMKDRIRILKTIMVIRYSILIYLAIKIYELQGLIGFFLIVFITLLGHMMYENIIQSILHKSAIRQ